VQLILYVAHTHAHGGPITKKNPAVWRDSEVAYFATYNFRSVYAVRFTGSSGTSMSEVPDHPGQLRFLDY